MSNKLPNLSTQKRIATALETIALKEFGGGVNGGTPNDYTPQKKTEVINIEGGIQATFQAAASGNWEEIDISIQGLSETFWEQLHFATIGLYNNNNSQEDDLIFGGTSRTTEYAIFKWVEVVSEEDEEAIAYQLTATDFEGNVSFTINVETDVNDKTKLWVKTDNLIADTDVILILDWSIKAVEFDNMSPFYLEHQDISGNDVQYRIQKVKDTIVIFNLDSQELELELTYLEDKRWDFATYEELLELTNNGLLKPNSFYVLTDYQTIFYQDLKFFEYIIERNEIYSAYQEPLVLKADTPNKLHEVGYGTMFVDKVYYDIRNDKQYYDWQTPNSKGTIYRRIDEFNNDLPYDFRFITFRKYMVDYEPEFLGLINWLDGEGHDLGGLEETSELPRIRSLAGYTFQEIMYESDHIADIYENYGVEGLKQNYDLDGKEIKTFYTFNTDDGGVINPDFNENGHIRDNKIEPSYATLEIIDTDKFDEIPILNENIFVQVDSPYVIKHNIIRKNSTQNIIYLTETFNNNDFGENSRFNTMYVAAMKINRFGNNFARNIIINDSYFNNNIVGVSFERNIFLGNAIRDNEFGHQWLNNIFLISIVSSEFRNTGLNNIFIGDIGGIIFETGIMLIMFNSNEIFVELNNLGLGNAYLRVEPLIWDLARIKWFDISSGEDMEIYITGEGILEND